MAAWFAAAAGPHSTKRLLDEVASVIAQRVEEWEICFPLRGKDTPLTRLLQISYLPSEAHSPSRDHIGTGPGTQHMLAVVGPSGLGVPPLSSYMVGYV